MAFLQWSKSAQFFDNSGNPLNGGKIRIYDAGTTSTKTVYQDSTSSTPWSQPITLDSSGRPTASIYIGSGAWKYTLETSAGAVFITEDNIPGDTVLTVDEFARPNMPVLSKSLSYTVLEDDIGSMIQADPTGGDVTITLISAVTAGDGAQIGVQHVGTANRVIVTSPQTVNGASSIQILKPRAGGVFTSNAGSWSGPVTDSPYTTLSKTTTYTVEEADIGRTIKADATGGAFTITLLPAATAGDGFEITIIKIDSSANAVTIDGDGSETINGQATRSLQGQWQAVKLRSDATNWQMVGDAKITPITTVDNTVPRYDSTEGKLQTSGLTIDDSNNVSTAGTYTSTATSADQIPTGTTAQRPSAAQGMVRENTDLDVLEHYNGSAWRILDRPLLHLREQQTANTAGTTITTGAFRTMVLNTEVTDEIGSTLSSNQWTLPAGSYEIIATPPAGASGSASSFLMKTKLRNVTDGSDTIIGPTATTPAGAVSPAPLVGRFTIAASKTFEFQMRCTTEITLPAANLGVVEVYAEVMIWRVA
jgi:hypothetical protein